MVARRGLRPVPHHRLGRVPLRGRQAWTGTRRLAWALVFRSADAWAWRFAPRPGRRAACPAVDLLDRHAPLRRRPSPRPWPTRSARPSSSANASYAASQASSGSGSFGGGGFSGSSGGGGGAAARGDAAQRWRSAVTRSGPVATWARPVSNWAPDQGGTTVWIVIIVVVVLVVVIRPTGRRRAQASFASSGCRSTGPSPASTCSSPVAPSSSQPGRGRSRGYMGHDGERSGGHPGPGCGWSRQHGGGRRRPTARCARRSPACCLVAEAYPDLRASTNFQQLRGRLTRTETSSPSPQYYNDACAT